MQNLWEAACKTEKGRAIPRLFLLGEGGKAEKKAMGGGRVMVKKEKICLVAKGGQTIGRN